MNVKKSIAVFMKSDREEHMKTIDTVRQVMKLFKVDNKFVERDSLKEEHLKKVDLIMTLGGDGTFLTTSHRVLNKTPLLGVNSDITLKEGFLCCANRFNFKEKFDLLLKGKNYLRKLSRLDAYIGTRLLCPALNEIYVGNEFPYITSRYLLEVGKQKEFQKSSGIIIGTPAGSHGWLFSAGGKKLPLDSERFELLVKDPYQGRLAKPKIINRIFSKKDTLKITSKYANNIAVIDSSKKEVYELKDGQSIVILHSKRSLNSIDFCR